MDEDNDDTEDMGDKHPLAPLSRLIQRAAEAVQGTGVTLHSLVFIPGADPNGPHRAQATFMADEEVPEAPDDETAAMLEGMEKATMLEEQKRKADEAAAGLADLLNTDDGIGLGDGDT